MQKSDNTADPKRNRSGQEEGEGNGIQEDNTGVPKDDMNTEASDDDESDASSRSKSASEEYERRGRLLSDLVHYNFGPSPEAKGQFSELFGLDSKSTWPWFRQGRRGIPAYRREEFEILIRNEMLSLPLGREIEDYIRPSGRSRYERAAEIYRRNEDLIALIFVIIKTESLGRPALESLMTKSMLRGRVLTPAHLFKWAYQDGGVPVSYQEIFANALIHSGIVHELADYLDLDSNDPRMNELYAIRIRSFFADGTKSTSEF